MKQLELWGGAECTVNRVEQNFRDQLCATGHQDRLADIDTFADLGFSAVRFPVLWERVAPERPDWRDWAWCDSRLTRLRELGIRPILGLVHHGSGPAYTSLLDDNFAPGLAEHAAAAAERYPWVEAWTPVNEPLTTARFSALYGHWYPHARDERLFWLALLNQVDGVRLSMRAARRVNSCARLIQTDDLGRTYATAAMADQAAFDNVRRWMSWDLLCGKVVPGHDFWQRLCDFGLEDRLRVIADDPCPPDVVGINHYLTSDRFLDHRTEHYPNDIRGGNGRRLYADVAAIRVLQPAPQGLRGAIREAWERYGLPIALTEVHNGCTREEQLRWTRDAWQAALEARDAGVALEAVTSWAIFGNRGWNTLLTAEGTYEPGAFDVSGEAPRPTAVAALIKRLPEAEPAPAALCGAGWWQRDIRFHHPVVDRPAPVRDHLGRRQEWHDHAAPILITGATGTLGQALAAACRHRDLAHFLTNRGELDLLDAASIEAALDLHRPWAVINASGWVRVDDAEHEAEACLRINADGAIALASACAERGIPSLSFSSDLVFGGDRATYAEEDPPLPLNVYGRSKTAMEQGILALAGEHLIVRTAAFFSPFDEHNFAIHAVRTLSRGERFQAAADSVVTPTYVPDLCNASLDLVIDRAPGIWHLANDEALSWAGFAIRLAEACGLDPALVDPVPGAELGWRAKRPPACALVSTRGCLMPTLNSAIERFAAVVSGDLRAMEAANACADERRAPPTPATAGAAYPQGMSTEAAAP